MRRAQTGGHKPHRRPGRGHRTLPKRVSAQPGKESPTSAGQSCEPPPGWRSFRAAAERRSVEAVTGELLPGKLLPGSPVPPGGRASGPSRPPGEPHGAPSPAPPRCPGSAAGPLPTHRRGALRGQPPSRAGGAAPLRSSCARFALGRAARPRRPARREPAPGPAASARFGPARRRVI